MRIVWKQRISKFLAVYVPLTVFLCLILLPFYWVLVTSLKPEGDIIKQPVRYIPARVTAENFVSVWKNIGLSTYMKNSAFVSIVSVTVISTVSLLAGYSLSRFRFKGRMLFLILLLCTQFIPGALLLIPAFLIFNSLKLINSHLSLVLMYSAFELPFATILMRGFIDKIPYELEEAAMVEGCNRTRTMVHVLAPLLAPALVAVGAFSFIACWNEFLYALMFINRQSRFTVSVGLSYMIGQHSIYYGALAAGSVIALIPPIVLFAYVQRYLVQGLSAGSVKG